MSESSISLCNFVFHSLVLGLLGWVVVRWVVRDARRRAHASLMAVLLTIGAPWTVATWPYPYDVPQAPVLTKIHQTLQTEWRIKVNDKPSSPIAKQVPENAPSAPVWTFDKIAHALRMVWLVGLFALIARLHWQGWKAWRWRMKLRVPTPEELSSMPRSVNGASIRVFDHEGSPCVVGPVAPVIAVPASAFALLTPMQWRWLLRHEGEHLRGRDVGTAWVLGWVRAFGWWNPFVHALIECFTRSREEICDAAAVSAAPAPEAYAEFLLDTASRNHSRTPGAVMPMVSSRPARRLRARLTALMSGHVVRKRLGWVYLTVCVISYLVAYFFIASIGFTARAEPPAPTPRTSAASDEDTRQITRTFKVPPNFLSRGETAMQKLKKAGVDFPEGASAVFNAATSQLIVRDTAVNLEKAATIAAAACVIPAQLFITGQIIEADKVFGVNRSMMNMSALSSLMNEARKCPGSHTVGGPSVTTKVGQRCSAEALKWNDELKKFAGFRASFDSSSVGDGKIKVHLDLEVERDPSQRFDLDRGLSKVNWSKLQAFRTSADVEVHTGDMLILHDLQSPSKLTICLAFLAVQTDGTLARNFDELSPVPVPSYVLPPVIDDTVPAKKVIVKTKVMEVLIPTAANDDPLNPIWLLDTTVHPSSAISKDKPADPAKAPPAVSLSTPGLYALSGVFSEEQCQSVLHQVSSRKGVEVTSLPDAIVKSGEDLLQDLPKDQGGGKLKIQPVIGPDEYTVDLNIAPMQEKEAREVTTAVTIWDNQTVVMGTVLKSNELGKHVRFIFVTARMLQLPLPAQPSK